VEIPPEDWIRLTEAEVETEAQRFIFSFIRQLEEGGSRPEDVAAHLAAGAQTLASLYLLIAKNQNPSPLAVRELVLRYALDPRQPVRNEANIVWKRVPEGWWINLGGLRIWHTPHSRLITGSQFLRYLDLALCSPPQFQQIMELIEFDLGGKPDASDGLPDVNADHAQPDHVDSSAFRPASECLLGEIDDFGKLRRALRENNWIRTQKPSPQRLMVHAGDWLKYLSRKASENALLDEAVEAVEARKAKISATKG
jgi:hypothetical protein